MPETKRINAYGKRPTRIVYVSNDRKSQDSPFTSHRTFRENTNVAHSPRSARKSRMLPRKVHGLSTSPRGSPRSGNVLGRAALKSTQDTMTPRRRPLVFKVANIPDSPSIVYLGEKPATSPTKRSRFTPFVDSEVMTVKDPAVARGGTMKGSMLRNELTEEIEGVRPSRKRAQKRPIVLTDDEEKDEDKPIPRPILRGVQGKPVVISDSSSDDYPAITRMPKTRALRAPKPPLEQQPPKAAARRVQEETSLPIAPTPSHIIVADRPKAPIARPSSPRRSQRNVLLPSRSQNEAQPAILTPESDIEPMVVKPKPEPMVVKPKPKPNGPSTKRTATNPQHLAPLLAECGQKVPHCFSAFIETFPFDDIHGPNPPANLAFRKIGEASYSEVFAIGSVVLKIVPLRNESVADVAVDPDLDMPQESDTKDVWQEVIVTRAMGQMCRGFIKLLSAYVVTGAYPTLLLSLWDTFHSAKGSENIHPGIFPQTQAYAVLVLPHGGPDLEAYTFPIKTGWRQACSIFWQTAKALAIAEELVSFEHRDLHWGQILVGSNASPRKVTPRRANQVGRVCMDDPSHGVTATIIDLGLARMDAGQNDVHWTTFDELIFEGEGDYQFDVYRMMLRTHGDTWDQYRPLTNVMWLHYLLSKLLHAKRLRAPGKRSAPVDGEFNEKQCHECLLDMEQQLGSCISLTKGRKGRGGGVKATFCNAGDVVDFAKGRGWVS